VRRASAGSAELCITRQIITAVKTARATSTPRSTSTSRSARRRRPQAPTRRPPSRRFCPVPPSATPRIRSSRARSWRAWSACLTSVLSELESRVLALYLDGHSYEVIGEETRLRHQDGRQRPPARQAQGRNPPRLTHGEDLSVKHFHVGRHGSQAPSRKGRSLSICDAFPSRSGSRSRSWRRSWPARAARTWLSSDLSSLRWRSERFEGRPFDALTISTIR